MYIDVYDLVLDRHTQEAVEEGLERHPSRGGPGPGAAPGVWGYVSVLRFQFYGLGFGLGFHLGT